MLLRTPIDLFKKLSHHAPFQDQHSETVYKNVNLILAKLNNYSIANLSALADLEEEVAMLDNMKETDILSDLDSNEDQPSAYSPHGLYIHQFSRGDVWET